MAPTESAAAAGPRAAVGATAGVPLLRAQNLHRVLGERDTAAHVLRGVNLQIHRGEYVSIVGASGSGKSTLLYLLGGLDRPTRADLLGQAFDPPSRVFIAGEDTTTLDDQELALLRNQMVGFIFQFHYLLKEFSAQENVALPIFKLGRLNRAQAMDRAAALLAQLGLGDKLQRKANRLSGGEQQRVAVARALANEPAVVLADEPTGNLDRHNGELVADIFGQLAQSGQTLVLVTHDVVLARRAGRMMTMEDGRVIRDDLLPHPGPAAVPGPALPSAELPPMAEPAEGKPKLPGDESAPSD